MKKTVVFDLDGTLLDTFPGIQLSANDVAERMGYGRVEEREKFFPFTGLPLNVGFPTVYGMNEEEAERAPKLFMEDYASVGCLSYEYYDGMLEVVKALHDEGVLMGVATLKTEDAAVRMIRSSRFSEYFSVIRGNNETDDAVKSELIREVIRELGSEPSDTVLIGDTVGDMTGALSAGCSFLGVGWGFGREELTGRTECVPTPAELLWKLRKQVV